MRIHRKFRVGQFYKERHWLTIIPVIRNGASGHEPTDREVMGKLYVMLVAVLLVHLCSLALVPAIEIHDTQCGEEDDCGIVSQETNNLTYSVGSTYEDELQIVLKKLRDTAKPGFAVAISPRKQAYGLIACNADISKDQCKDCSANAATSATARYPNRKGVALWRNLCFLRYDDYDFLSETSKGCSSEYDSVSHPKTFNMTLFNLLSNLTAETTRVSSNGLGNGYVGYAYGSARDAASKVDIYASVQCWGYTNASSCERCLMHNLERSYTSESRRIFCTDCGLRYSTHKFYSGGVGHGGRHAITLMTFVLVSLAILIPS